MRKINASSMKGEIRPLSVTASKVMVSTSMKIWARIRSLRRSTMSARAPAGSAKRNNGKLVAAATRDTMRGDESRLVISQAVATLAIQPPMLVMSTALQTVRKTGTLSGLQAVAIAAVGWGLL